MGDDAIRSALLTGKALHIFSMLSRTDQVDFDNLKDALMRGYDLTEEGFRRKFRAAKIQPGETYAQFGVRIEHYFVKSWVELTETAEDFDGLKELILREQILNGCSPDLVVHLKLRQLQRTAELLTAAEVLREAR